MARVRIYYTRAGRESNDAAVEFVREVLRQIQFQARLHVAFGPYTMGTLAGSIQRQGPFMEFGMVSGNVGSDLDYAAAVEGGSGLYGPRRSKYVIRPRSKTYLKFYWRKVGHIVRLRQVNHPGQRGKGYLRKAAESVGRRHNMIVIIRDI